MTKVETMTLTIKAQALKNYLEEQNCTTEDITDILDLYEDEDTVSADGEDLLILFDDEANEYCTRYILETLWAFNPDFITSHVGNDRIDDYDALITSIRSIQEQCEGANSAIKAMINDLDQFVQDAISSDGRGHFMNTYDGEEYETSVTIEEKLEHSKGHPTFVSQTHFIYIYRV